MKKLLLFPLLIFHTVIFAQKIDSIYFNLYTDSLKKGTYNYINVEGKLANGSIRPLDSTQLSFISSYSKFSGNSLWIPFEADEEKVNITVILKSNSNKVIYKTIYIKKKKEDSQLKTVEEILADPPKTKSKKQH
ncbi:MAG: hypothetical protein QM768_05375 [Agriterribacter sp.]